VSVPLFFRLLELNCNACSGKTEGWISSLKMKSGSHCLLSFPVDYVPKHPPRTIFNIVAAFFHHCGTFCTLCVKVQTDKIPFTSPIRDYPEEGGKQLQNLAAYTQVFKAS
jgi:hypothetical protein